MEQIRGSTQILDSSITPEKLTPGNEHQILTISGGVASWESGLILPNVGLKLLDTDASHTLTLAPGSDLTADHTLTITTGDADRTLTLANSGTAVVGTGTATRLAQWSDANTIAASTLIKSGAGVLTLDAGGAYTLRDNPRRRSRHTRHRRNSRGSSMC